MSGASLVYGIGAAKAGTTWLHRVLSAHPGCHFRAVKELHYFDTAPGDMRRDRLSAKRLKALNRRRAKATGDSRDLGRKLADTRDWRAMMVAGGDGHQAYLDYLNAGNEGGKLVGDITPSYATLTEARFAEMAALGRNARFIFLMRDPFDRLWSNIRMSAYRETNGGAQYAKRATKLLDSFNDGHHPAAEARSDYAATLRRLQGAVAKDKVLTGFFEDLFTQDALDRITAFLGLVPIRADLQAKVHAGHDLTPDDDRRARAVDRLRPQYDAVSQYLAGPLPARWQAQLSRG